jgi:glycosyltransferase involved in cell wall biosynthesis
VNIWYVHPYAGGPGIGRFYRPWHLAREWAKLGHTTTVLVADYHHLLDKDEPLAPRKIVDGIPYVALNAGRYKGNGFDRILNMARYCRSLWTMRNRVGHDLPKPDVIIASSPHPFTIYPARALAKRFNAKLAFEVRDLWPLSMTEINGTPIWHPLVWLTAFTERYAYRNADLVASLLPGVENYIKERGMVYRAFVWVPNGVDTARDAAPAVPPKSDEGQRVADLIADWKREGRAVIIHPGSMGPPNGLDNLIEAVALLNGKGMEKKFGVLLLGTGVSRARLEALAAAKTRSNIAFGGPVPKSETQYLIALCDLGYSGGVNNERVYRYGMSFNKTMDFANAGLRIVMPFSSFNNPVEIFKLGVCAADSTPAGIAEALAEALASDLRGIDKDDFAAFERDYAYSKVAANYIRALC